VGLELLTLQISLPLQHFAVRSFESEQCVYPALQPADKAIPRVQDA